MKLLGVVLLSVSLLTACGSKSNQAFRHPAPTSKDQVGLNVSGATAEQMEAVAATGAQVRELNARHGMYEVVGATKSEISALVPNSKIEKNRYIENLIGKGSKKAFNPMGEPEECSKVLDGVEVFVATDVEMGAIINRDQRPRTFSFVAQQTVRMDSVGPAVKVPVIAAYEWVVAAPDTSLANLLEVKNQRLSFVPDEMGMYIVAAITQINGVICTTGTVFAVTDSVKFQNPTPATPLDLVTKLTKFPHLKVLEMDKAWGVSEGQGVVVAVTDTGTDYNHPDLAGNIALNTKEIPNNGLDDDKNGYVDDVYGWNFVGSNSTPYDDQMHGTHCSGLAVGNVGMAPKAKVLPIKVINAFGGGDIGSIAAGLRYAVDAGAKIVSVSLGFDGQGVESIQDAITYGESKGVLFVVAAGNESTDIDVVPSYPAAFKNDNILTVAATNLAGKLTVYTNTGAEGVDLAAPGGSPGEGGLLSTAYANSKGIRYLKAMGTSMATPVVAGAAALVLSKNPKMGFKELKNALLSGGVLKEEYAKKVKGQKFLNPVASLGGAKITIK